MVPDLDNIPYAMLNRYGRRSLAAMNRRQPYRDRMFKWQQHSRRIAESRAASLRIRIERIKKRKEARIKMETIGKKGIFN